MFFNCHFIIQKIYFLNSKFLHLNFQFVFLYFSIILLIDSIHFFEFLLNILLEYFNLFFIKNSKFLLLFITNFISIKESFKLVIN